MHGILDDVVGEVIGLTVGDASLDTAAGQPHAEAAAMVVTPAAKGPLAVGSTAKLTTPDDQGVIEHAALFEISHQSGRSLVGVLALGLEVLLELSMLVPAAVEELGETHATLRHAAGDQTIVGEGAGLSCILPVEVKGTLRLI